jgi:hypothetical protein
MTTSKDLLPSTPEQPQRQYQPPLSATQADSPKDSLPSEPPTPTSNSIFSICADIVFFAFVIYGMVMFIYHTINGYSSPAQALECPAVPGCPACPEYPAVLACPEFPEVPAYPTIPACPTIPARAYRSIEINCNGDSCSPQIPAGRSINIRCNGGKCAPRIPAGQPVSIYCNSGTCPR